MSANRFDVVALGELLIDFIQSGISAQSNPLFEANPGGAPCNYLSMLSMLGRRTAFIGKVGEDQFGHLLKKAIEDAGIDSTHLVFDQIVPTTLAFVHHMPDGDRDFSFYRNPGADMMLGEEDVRDDLILSARVFHFGTLSMTSQKSRNATQKAVRIAQAGGLILSFDPNIRPPLWESLEEAKKQMEYGLQHCDVLKISEEELFLAVGCSDLIEAMDLLKKRYQIKLALITLGDQGSVACYKDWQVIRPAFHQEHCIDTTGAGDTFFASAMDFLLDHDLDHLTESDLVDMLDFANAAASLITTKKGALSVMPDRQSVLGLVTARKTS